MMLLVRSKWSLYDLSRVYGVLYYSSSTAENSLFLRICRAGDPSVPMARMLDQWVEEGRTVNQFELKSLIKHLRKFRRFQHALQISQWMSYERHYDLSTGDIAVRLDLISKVQGLGQAERYFSSIPDTSRDLKVYGALLHCYAENKSVEKAEAIMQKIRKDCSKYIANLIVSYNAMLNLYARMGKYEKLDSLMQEMKEKGICNTLTFNIRLNTYVTALDIEGMDNLLMQMEADPFQYTDWSTYTTAAKGYLKAGHFEKALTMLKRSEQLTKGKIRRVTYESLLTTYAAIGNKDEVYRIWNIYNNLGKFHNSGYICILSSLVKLDDLDGAERILEEWESRYTCFDTRIPNLMISAYCKKGLLEKAEAIIRRLLESDKELNGSVWGRLANGYCINSNMDKAFQTMKKAILAAEPAGWKPNPFTLAACIEHMKDKGDLQSALEILRLCEEQGYFSAATYNSLLSYVHSEIPDKSALDLIKGDYHLEDNVEAPDGEKYWKMDVEVVT